MLPLRLLAAGALVLGAASPASAQTVINSVPYTISVSGKYVLGGNLAVTNSNQSAIVINAPNVILDLNGFYVSGPGNTPDSTTAVILVGNFGNVTIRNGTVANLGYGIYFSAQGNARNYLVEDVNVTHCYLYGIYFTTKSPGSILHRNSLSENGGSTSPSAPNFPCSAIFSNGGVSIEDNTISVVTASGAGASFGINSFNGDASVNNTVTDCQIGISGGKYRDNLTYNCATPFTGGTAIGFNN